ncbi:MAG: hypothetical protein ACE5GE_07475 [Phycisphaerae bacterium]
MKTKTFDCVEMKRRAAAAIHRQTKDLTLEQKIDYWRRRSEAFRSDQARLMGEAQTTDKA